MSRSEGRLSAGRSRPPARAGLIALWATALVAGGCSPVYVLKAGYHEAKILAAREPISRLVSDTTVDDGLREKLRLALDARAFARDSLGFDVGDSYLTYSELESDTLALVLSAAHRDRLEPVTWWFPIVGRIPYRAYFDEEEALREREELETEGYDTYLRPTAAFSTLGWFADPLLSTVVRQSDVGLVETVIHELSHNTLYLPDRTRFNESFASFAGATGAVAYFCGKSPTISAGAAEAGAGDDERCSLARERWTDDRRFSRFLDGLEEELRALYGRDDLPRAETLRRRDAVFARAKERFREEVRPGLEAHRFSFFTDLPLNNATLLARMRYYHRLDDFDARLRRHGGDIRETVAAVAADARRAPDPFAVLVPQASSPASSRHDTSSASP